MLYIYYIYIYTCILLYIIYIYYILCILFIIYYVYYYILYILLLLYIIISCIYIYILFVIAEVIDGRLKGKFVSPNIINLSTRILSNAEISLLSKGLKFIPTPSVFFV